MRAAKRRKLVTQFLGFPDEVPDGDEHPPGDANLFNQFLMFCVFWDDVD